MTTYINFMEFYWMFRGKKKRFNHLQTYWYLFKVVLFSFYLSFFLFHSHAYRKVHTRKKINIMNDTLHFNSMLFSYDYTLCICCYILLFFFVYYFSCSIRTHISMPLTVSYITKQKLNTWFLGEIFKWKIMPTVIGN